MSERAHSFVPVLGHELHVTTWGNPTRQGLVMWHGLARTGRDFDELAQALSDEYFVICPDTIGRGLSSWSREPEAEYSLAHYSAIAEGLLDHFGIAKAAWIGTSMGGLIGMWMASGRLADRLSCLVINDIAPEIPQDAVDRILSYVGDLPEFDHAADAGDWLRTVYAPFGPASETFWTRMTRTSLRRKSNGQVTLHYDPKIVVQFEASADELTSWDRYARITCPVHVIYGAQSDLLTPDLLARMQAEGPKPRVTGFADCGHAPTMSREADIKTLRDILCALTRQPDRA